MSKDEQTLSDRELATMWLGYGFSHEQLQQEVERRWPRLAGWKAATDHLLEVFSEQEQGVALNLPVSPDDPVPAGYDQLRAEYRRAIEQIAAGQPYEDGRGWVVTVEWSPQATAASEEDGPATRETWPEARQLLDDWLAAFAEESRTWRDLLLAFRTQAVPGERWEGHVTYPIDQRGGKGEAHASLQRA